MIYNDPILMGKYIDYCEYLESTGTQYIDTGIKGSSILRVVCDVSGFPNTKYSQAIFGARSGVNGSDLFVFLAAEDMKAYRSDYKASKPAYVGNYTGRFQLDKNRNVTTAAGGATLTDTSEGAFTSLYSIYLFGCNTAGSHTLKAIGVRIYSCQMYENDVLVRDFWPCIAPDGTACLYDKVSRQYFENAGTGEFVTDRTETPVGTTWTITESGTWEAPATGKYQVELHGGGGGAAGGTNAYVSGGQYYAWSGGAGGGSGEVFETVLTKGQQIAASIGLGGAGGASGANGRAGGTTAFASLSVNGGGPGTAPQIVGGVVSTNPQGGTASGSIATNGQDGYVYTSPTGGYGNKNKTSQSYGNGGGGAPNGAGGAGQPGAVILTYLGKG